MAAPCSATASMVRSMVARVDERARCVVHQDHVIVAAAGVGDEPGERVADGLLADVAALDHMNLAAGAGRAEAELGDLRANALDLGLAHGDVDGLDAWDREECAQAVDQHGHACNGEKLLGSGVAAAHTTARGHPRSNPCSRKNDKHTHSQRSIQDSRAEGTSCGPGLPVVLPMLAIRILCRPL